MMMDGQEDRHFCKNYAIKHRLASELWAEEDVFDPFQVFEVCQTKCHRIRVHVLNGSNITKGPVSDFLDVPDPYILLWVPGTPNGIKRTRTVDNCRNPRWDHVFDFYVNPDLHNELSVMLMDANVLLLDSRIGQTTISLDDLKLDINMDLTIMFRKGSKVHMKILRETNFRPDLRFSLALSDGEKNFLRKRRRHVLEGMKKFLGEEEGPKCEREVPCVAVLGSGGGMRALIGYSGACNALHKLGVLDCAMFNASLSGSSWFLSYLYSQPDFPHKGPKDFESELRGLVENCAIQFLKPSSLYSCISDIVCKSLQGQPISLTDLFGHMLGQTLLKEKKNSKLSEQRKILEDGQAPLPLYTCINVKKNVSARVFQEWIEFSPFEIGAAKYGTFSKPESFGSKFYLGNVIRKFEEPPLHFLQGIWGSAYSIQFKRLVKEMLRITHTNVMDGVELDEDDMIAADGAPEWNRVNNESGSSESDVESQDSDDPDVEDTSTKQKTQDFLIMERRYEERSREMLSQIDYEAATFSRKRHNKLWRERKMTKLKQKERLQNAVLEEAVEYLLGNSVTNSRALRAGLVYNAMRGLELQSTFPLPDDVNTEPRDEVEFKGHFEAIEMKNKKLFLVDSGLAFNLPFPLLLRPQRAVDLYLCFEFSLRKADTDSPFEELRLTEKWAKLNKVPFPPIDAAVKEYLTRPFQECYVFEDVNDPYCPVVLFFPLINNQFRLFKAPGVKRETEEEINFGSFDIFSDPEMPFDTFKFQYSNEEFDRLAGLVEFNTLVSRHVIDKYMKMAVERKRDLLPRPLISMNRNNYSHLKPKSMDLEEKLNDYMKIMSELQQTSCEA